MSQLKIVGYISSNLNNPNILVALPEIDAGGRALSYWALEIYGLHVLIFVATAKQSIRAAQGVRGCFRLLHFS